MRGPVCTQRGVEELNEEAQLGLSSPNDAALFREQVNSIAIHAVSEASRLQVDIEAQSQKLLAWQEAQEIALRPVMRLYPPGAGFMSTTDFAKPFIGISAVIRASRGRPPKRERDL